MTDATSPRDYPHYLNKKFFKESIENGLQHIGIEVESLDLTMGSSAGDNYCSDIYRAKIIYKESDSGPSKELSLVIKSIPHSEARNVIFELDFPNKEKLLYQEVIPKLESLLPATKFAPKLYHVIKDPLFTFAFEDLKAKGFTMGNRQHGLNESECKMVLTRLGKFHACSMHLLQKEPKYLEYPGFQYGIFKADCIDDPLLESFFVDSLKTELTVVESWPGFEKYANKMKKIHANVKERLLNVVASNEDKIKVLVHGDLWVNNFMFKYDEEDKTRPIDLRFLDFQASFLSSPGIDLNYFLNTSVKHEVLVEKRETLIRHYYDSLSSTLEYLKYDGIPTLDQIKAEIHRKEFYGFMSAVGVLPVLCIDEINSTDCSIELFSDKDAAERKRLLACKSKRFEQIMKYMLKRADDIGALE